MKKQSVVWFMLALLSILAAANICWAVEEDEDGNIRQSQPLALDGDESVAPKPKVIIKERVVMRCAPGSVWSPKNKRCISEDGEAPPPPRYQAPAPRQQAEAPRGDRYVYPGTKLRIKMDKCTMVGETVKCEMSLTNTVDQDTAVDFEGAKIVDENRSAYKSKNWHYLSSDKACSNSFPVRCWPIIKFGNTARVEMSFVLVDPSANAVSFVSLVKANNGSDLVKFGSIPLIK